jgi:hypothetical protein
MTNFHWVRAWLMVAASLALILSAGYSEAAEATPPARSGDVGDAKSHDVAAGLAGIGTYVGVSVAGALLAIPAATSGSEPLGRAGVVVGAGLMMVAPAVAGELVCVVENRSERYQSSCTLPIVGAYAGLLLGDGVLLAAAGDGHGPLLIPGLVVALVLPALGAVAGWHIGKAPRVEASRDSLTLIDEPPPVFAPETVQRRASLTLEPVLAFPVFARRF